MGEDMHKRSTTWIPGLEGARIRRADKDGRFCDNNDAKPDTTLSTNRRRKKSTLTLPSNAGDPPGPPPAT